MAIFPHFNGTEVPYTFVSVDQYNVDPDFVIPSIYGYKRIRNRFRQIRKTRRKISVDIRIFLTVYWH